MHTPTKDILLSLIFSSLPLFSLQKRIIDDFVLFMAVKWLSVFTKKVSSSLRQNIVTSPLEFRSLHLHQRQLEKGIFLQKSTTKGLLFIILN